MQFSLRLLIIIFVCLGLTSCANMKKSGKAKTSGKSLVTNIDEAESTIADESTDVEKDLEDLDSEEDEEDLLTLDDDEEEKPEIEQIVEAPPPVEPEVASEERTQATKPVSIKNISFQSHQNGGTIVVSTAAVVNYRKRFNAERKQFVLEISPAQLPVSLKRAYVMKDFKAAFKGMKAYQKKGSKTVRLIVQLRSSREPLVQAEGATIFVMPSAASSLLADDSSDKDAPIIDDEEVAAAKTQPKKRKKSAKDNSSKDDSSETNPLARNEGSRILNAKTLNDFLFNNNKFYGRPISVVVDDVDVKDAINFISEESGANIVIAEGVSGKISLKLRDVPWDQVLVTILRSKKLGYVRQGNILFISSIRDLEAETETARKVQQASTNLEPLITKVFPISFAQESVQGRISAMLTPSIGKVSHDSRTGTLIVTDKSSQIERISRVIAELDIPPAQVMIEGKVVEASENFSRSVGVNWGLDGSLTVSETAGAGGGPIVFEPSFKMQSVAKQTLQAAGGVFTFGVGALDFFGDITSTLALAETNGVAKVIASVRVVAMNGENATIDHSQSILGLNAAGDSDVTEVGLNLKVTPQITPNRMVILDFDLSRDFPGAIADPESGTRNVNSRSAKTKVLVKDGSTAVLGGVYQTTQSKGETGLPVVRSIPLLGWLFKAKSTDKSKNEMLMFITPRIIDQNQVSE